MESELWRDALIYTHESTSMFHDVVLALKRNGAYMPVRDKGPIFIVYPFDQDPQFFDQVYMTRAIWQLNWMKLN